MNIRKICLFILLYILVIPSASHGHTPQDISISVDSANNKVNITVKHISDNPRKDYIAMVEIIPDKNAPIKNRFYFQVGDKKELSVAIEGLDKTEKLTIRAYPSKGKYLERVFELKDFRKDKIEGKKDGTK